MVVPTATERFSIVKFMMLEATSSRVSVGARGIGSDNAGAVAAVG